MDRLSQLASKKVKPNLNFFKPREAGLKKILSLVFAVKAAHRAAFHLWFGRQ
jgi:hypothetical protein